MDPVKLDKRGLHKARKNENVFEDGEAFLDKVEVPGLPLTQSEKREMIAKISRQHGGSGRTSGQ